MQIDDDDGENLLPLLYNAQQEEIVKKLKNHFAVLVQGPPGTGKSHTIGNIVSSLLARGKRVLVTSQTENALKVLREYIPTEIRSLCVSQLGSDSESKRQLNEAVESIGKHHAEGHSRIVDQKIQHLKNDLRVSREEQAKLLTEIRDWIELDSCKITIDHTVITAYQAARECSEGQEVYSWFPDPLSPDAAPSLTHKELLEMCSLLKEIAIEDRNACHLYLPNTEVVLSPDLFSQKISGLRVLTNVAAETENSRGNWDGQLAQASQEDLERSISFLEETLAESQKIAEPWQLTILGLMTSEPAQNDYWQNFFKQCTSLRNKVWRASLLSKIDFNTNPRSG